MTLGELKELFCDMQDKEITPLLCDTEVMKYDAMIPCGEPTMCYESPADEKSLFPKELLSMHPEFVIPVRGDSMVNVCIMTGDMVKVICYLMPMDGDVVLACIDGEYTLKTYCKDEEGQQWLLPQNEKYEPILLDEQSNVRIYGQVKEVLKPAPRVSYRDCLKIINQAKRARCKKCRISDEKVAAAIVDISEQVMNGRQWFAVYRALVDKEVMARGDFAGVCVLVRNTVPAHEHLPVDTEIARLDIQSFRKHVRQWDANDAPVSGKRYRKYLQIGLRMLELLENG